MLFVISAILLLGEWAARRTAPFELRDGQINLLLPSPEQGITEQFERDGVPMWRRAHPGRAAPAAQKPPFRIVVLGDSIVQPAGVPDAQGAVALLQSHLNRYLDGGPYEVVNLSEGGYATLQEEQQLYAGVLDLKPDLLLLGLAPNDADEFTVHDGQLVMARLLDDAASHRAASGLAGLAFRHLYLVNSVWLALERVSLNWSSAHVDADHFVQQPIQRMFTWLRNGNAHMAIVCFPRLDVPLQPSTRCEFPTVGPWARAARVPYLDPAADYATYPLARIKLDHIHLNPTGHQLLAALLFDWLVDNNAVPFRAAKGRPPRP